MAKEKTITFRADAFTNTRIEKIKDFYEKTCGWPRPDTTTIIEWSIAKLWYDTPEGKRERNVNLEEIKKLTK